MLLTPPLCELSSLLRDLPPVSTAIYRAIMRDSAHIAMWPECSSEWHVSKRPSEVWCPWTVHLSCCRYSPVSVVCGGLYLVFFVCCSFWQRLTTLQVPTDGFISYCYSISLEQGGKKKRVAAMCSHHILSFYQQLWCFLILSWSVSSLLPELLTSV